MRYLSPSLFLLASAVALGQSSSTAAPAKSFVNTPPSVTTFTIDRASSGCPVGFSANRQADTNLITVDRDVKPYDGPKQGLHLMVDHLNRPAIQSIEVTVYGTSLKPRALPVAPPSDGLVSRTFELHRTTGSDSLSEADVWMHQVGSVRWADLISITYTDGTSWHAMPTLECRAVPSNLLLVGVR